MARNTDITAAYVGRRLKEYFESEGINQSEIAERLNISQAGVSARFTGVRAFGKNAAARWSEEFGFRPGFLITGEGLMFPDDDPRNGGRVVSNVSGSTFTLGDNSPISGPSEAEIRSRVLEAENKWLRDQLYKAMAKLAALGQPCEEEGEICSK